MAKTKILARGFIFQINTGTIGVPVWTPIGGINNFSFDPSKSDADTTDFDSDGRAEHMVASRSYAMSIEGFHKVDVADGSRDLGQAAVETLADEIGPDSLGNIRFFHEDSGNGKSFMASANVTGPGGGNDDPAAWGAEFTISGAVTDLTGITP